MLKFLHRFTGSGAVEARAAITEQLYPFLLGPETSAGMAVSAETALDSPTVLACVSVISRTISSLPLHVFKRGSNGERHRDTDHPAAGLLNGFCNPWTASSALRAQVQADALLHGAGYIQATRVRGRLCELHRLPPMSVTAETDDATGAPRYRLRQKGGGDRILAHADVIVIMPPEATADRPVSLVRRAREAIGLELALLAFEGRTVKNGARPSLVLESENGKDSEDRLDRIRRFVDAQMTGHRNAGKPLILSEGYLAKTVSMSLVDLQFLELRRFTVEEIARTFSVPLTLIGSLDRAVWRNVEELNDQFLRSCVLPWLGVWQDAIARVCFSPEERSEYFAEFVTDALTRPNLAGRYSAYRQATGGAWLTPNEVRRLDNREPIEGGGELIRQAGQSQAPTTNPTPTEKEKDDAGDA